MAPTVPEMHSKAKLAYWRARAFLAEFLGLFGLLPDSRILQLPTDFLEPLFLVVVLKETPVTKPLVRRGL